MKVDSTKQQLSFVSIPEAYSLTDKGLRDVIKFKFQIEYRENSKNPLKLQEVYFTDKFLVDLSAVDLGALDPEKILKDCEFVQNRVARNPKSIHEIVKALQSADIKKAENIVKEIGFTEEDSVRAGGGLVGLIIVVIAAAALSGCGHCGAERPASDPKAGPEQ